MKYSWFPALTALAVLTGCLAASAARADLGMSSTNYRIPTSVINSGGGVASSANYTLIASVGEPIIGLIGTPPPAGTDNYQINAGFLATLIQVIGRPGDLNNDGSIDILDVKLALQIAAGLANAQSPSINFPNGDVSPVAGDGKINILDADKIKRYLEGKQPTLP